MVSWRNARGVALLCAVLALSAAPALGQSAGNQQYVDPLASTTPTAPASTSSPPATAQNTSPAATSSSSGSAASPTATTASSSSGAPARSASGTLPFTGLDLWPAVGVGFGLIASGIAIRRVTRRA